MTGRLVPSHDPEDFARCLEELLDEPSLRKRMGEAGVERARAYTWEHATDRALEGYRGVVASAKVPATAVPC